ncbi:adenosine deaminase [Frondihabitans cladoniiphilus]|uniref:Adenosine deaminase n=1 Tax=Frondihabitans cladoniiphilus TaxID=715785 RepID=A0ABP8VW63_9MICO
MEISEAWIRSIPKAEVHVHLEGGFELIDILDLAKSAGESLPGPARSLFDVATHFEGGVVHPPLDPSDSSSAEATGLGSFLQFLDWQCGLIRTAEQAARHAYRFAARQSGSGVSYTDVIVNPTHWSAWRGREPELLDALAKGLDEAEQDGLCTVNLCVSLLRQQSADEGSEVARWIARDRPNRVVALSIDGDERAAGRTGARFAEAFTIARDAGIHRTVHAGESSGPEGVWDALDLLHAERIDHGVRAVDDPALLARLADSDVSLGVCPRSNIVLGLYPDWAHHPLRALQEAGVTVTLNTDDPAPLGTRLEAEWAKAAQVWEWQPGDVTALAHTSIDASFAPVSLKQALHAEIDAVQPPV